MKLKPSKCRSFSLARGSPKKVSYFIGEDKVPSIAEQEQKFLGKIIFYTGKSKETLNFLKETFTTKLDNIEKTLVRNEYKLWIYVHYFLPSIRFLLTVYTITSTDLNTLDRLTHKYMKKWSGLPQCATNSIFHSKHSLNIQSISSLYDKAHCVSHTRTRLLGDKAVNHVLDCSVNRESLWTRKKSVTVRAENVFQKALEGNTVFGMIPEGEGWEEKAEEVRNNITQYVKHCVKYDNEKVHTEHVAKLAKQGKLLELANIQKNDLTWKSYIFNLKKNTLKFVLNSTLDTLPSNSNLFQWGKAPSDKCKNCGGRETTSHILVGCPTSLNQGRFTYRHDNILHYVANSLDKSKYECFIDIPGHQTSNNGTIPSDITITADRPDIVIINRKDKIVYIFELTACFEMNISTRHTFKENKYAYFLTDIKNFTTTVIAFEIGARGYVTRENCDRLKLLRKFCKKGIKAKKFIENISAIAVNSSYLIFINRKEPNWSTEIPPLLPPFKDD